MTVPLLVAQSIRAFIRFWLDMVDPCPELGGEIGPQLPESSWDRDISKLRTLIEASADLTDLKAAAFMPSALPWALMPIEVMSPLYEKILALGGRDPFVLETFSSYLAIRYKFEYDTEAEAMAAEAAARRVAFERV